MYKNNLWITAFALSSIFFSCFAKEEKIRGSKHKHSHRSEQKCQGVKIRCQDINRNGYVICKPGEYYLCEDVTYNPCDSNPAIRISAGAVGNVTIDLNGKTLSLKSKTAANIAGVLIEPGLTNVIVKNGTIRDFSDAGIRAGKVVKSGSVPVITELSFSDIRAFNNGTAGVLVDPNSIGDGAGGIVILNAQDVDVTDCVLNENIFAGLRGYNITKFTMENCHCDDAVATDWQIPGQPTSLGANFDGDLNDMVFNKSTFNRNISGSLSGGLGLGFLIPEVTATANVVVDSCQINDNSVTLSDPVVAAALNIAYVSGCEIVRATNVVINNTQISGTSVVLDTPLTVGGSVYCDGIVVNRNTNLSITNCEVSGMTATLKAAAAPFFPAIINVFLQGISGAHDVNCTMSNCLVSNSTFNNMSNVAVGLGNQSFAFYIANGFTISNCHSFGNMSVDNSTGFNNTPLLITEGFDFAICENILLEDCSSSGHTQAASNPTTTASVIGSIASTSNGPVLTVSKVLSGTLVVGQTLSGDSILPDTTITGYDTGMGGTGTYFVSVSQTIPSTTISASVSQFSQVGGLKADCSTTTACGPVVFRRCVASGNVDTGTGIAFGFSTREPVAPMYSGVSGPYVFDSCIAESNTNSSGTGTGFDLWNIVNSKVINCFAESNNIGINVTDFSSFASNNNIISNNVISANTNYGIQDSSAGASNAYYSNQAKNNGPTPATTNYSGATIFPPSSCPPSPAASTTPILFWQLPKAPCNVNSNGVPPTNLDNLSIIN